MGIYSSSAVLRFDQKAKTEEQPVEGPPGKKRKIENGPTKLPNVIKLVLSPDHKHAVAVTGDDKCIRVFEIASEGKLIELSQRKGLLVLGGRFVLTIIQMYAKASLCNSDHARRKNNSVWRQIWRRLFTATHSVRSGRSNFCTQYTR